MCTICRDAGLFGPAQPVAPLMAEPAASVAPGLPSGIRQAFTGVERIDAVLTGLKWDSLALTYSTPDAVSAFDLAHRIPNYTSDSLIAKGLATFVPANAAIIAAVPAVLAQFAAVSGLTFAPAASRNDQTATLKIGQLDFSAGLTDKTDIAFFPWRDSYRIEGIFLDASGRDGAARAPERGNYDWVTLIHEIGHALGLKHPFQVQLPKEYAPPNLARSPAERNSTEYSVMSYTVATGTLGPDGLVSAGFAEKWGEAQTLMQDDIQALQVMYGANYAHNATDTVYSFSATTGEMFVNGVGQGRPGGAGTDPRSNIIFGTVWDGGGNDTYDLSNFAFPAARPPGSDSYFYYTLDLTPGGWLTFSEPQLANIGGGSLRPDGATAPVALFARGNIANALLFQDDPRALIENVSGTQTNDVIIGNQANNRLSGNGGNDAIRGNGGDDILSGGAGANFLDGGDGFDRALFEAQGRRGWEVEVEEQLGVFATGFSRGATANQLTRIEEALFADGSLSFAASSPFATAHRLYSVVLGREADLRGLDAAGTFVANAPNLTAALSQLAGQMLASAEFGARFGTALTNAQFVGVLYQNLRGGPGDPGGVAAWTAALDSGSATRAQLAVQFAQSAEALGRTAERLATGIWDADDGAIMAARAYQGVLNRAPDMAGLRGWDAALDQGALTPLDLFRAFLASPEGQGLYGGTSNAAYVQRLYQNALDRTADPTGLADFVAALESGTFDRGQVALSIATSAEFDRVQGGAIFGTPADPGILFA
ncbi:MAG: DUF4214 domain-containing protein [Acetobacteraceae bacterium]|nr:DUF4214 domain-containing protein [Acetobacteraceae bacterium]